MACDVNLAARIRVVLAETPGLVEKKMFGGVAFLLNGNMACGVNQNNLIIRLAQVDYPLALAKEHVGVFDMAGRAMVGWVVVQPPGCQSEEQLRAWILQGVRFAQTLPPK